MSSTVRQPQAIVAMSVMNAAASESDDLQQCEHEHTHKKHSPFRFRGAGAAKDCFLGIIGCFLCFECCEGCCGCVADIICCPCEVCC